MVLICEHPIIVGLAPPIPCAAAADARIQDCILVASLCVSNIVLAATKDHEIRPILHKLAAIIVVKGPDYEFVMGGGGGEGAMDKDVSA